MFELIVKIGFGMILGLLLALCIIVSAGKVIKTKTKLNPEWELVTDGKKVDTIWIYKEPRHE